METRKMTAKELLSDIETFVHIGGFETSYRINHCVITLIMNTRTFAMMKRNWRLWQKWICVGFLRREKENYITFLETTIPVTTFTLMMDVNFTMAK